MRWFVGMFLVAVVGLSLVPSPAYAAGSGKAASATLMAAALETAGYYAQEKILADLKDLIENLGALIFLGCLISGILTAALNGNYQSARWFLIGPVMFFFLIRAEQATAGADWQFAQFNDPTRERERILQASGIDVAQQAKVSRIFHQYNLLISDITQESIKILTNDDAKKLMLFATRPQVMDGLFGMSAKEDYLIHLVTHTLRECTDEIAAARYIARAMNNPDLKTTAEYAGSVTKYCATFQKKDKAFPESLREKVWAAIGTQLSQAGNGGYTYEGTRKVSCQDFWHFIIVGLRSVAEGQTEETITKTVPSYFASVYKQIYDDIVQRISRIKYNYNDQNAPGNPQFGRVPCFNITLPVGGFGVPGFSLTINKDVDGRELVPIIFAAWMVRKLVNNDPRSQMMAQLYDHAGVEGAPNNHREMHTLNENQEKVRRFRNQRLAESTKWEVYTLTMLLPYVQGAGLYVLAVLYPFFAMMAIIPGRGSTFFMWMALWAWLKCWDIGFAIVMIMDQALWELMPHTAHYRLGGGAGGGSRIEVDPVTIFEAAFSGDYAYNISTYYVLLSGILTAVPVISAHAILGSKKALAGIVVSGLKSIGQPLGKAAGDWVAAEQVHEDDRTRELQQFMYARSRVDAEYMSLIGDSRRFNSAPNSEYYGLRARLAAQEIGQKMGLKSDFFSAASIQKTNEAIAASEAKFNPADRNRDIFSMMSGENVGAMLKDPLKAVGEVFTEGTEPPVDQAATKELQDSLVRGGMPPDQAAKFKKYNLQDRSRRPLVVTPEMVGNPKVVPGARQYLLDPSYRTYSGPTEEFRKWRQNIEITRRDGDVLRALSDRLQLAGMPALFTGGILGKAADQFPLVGKIAKFFTVPVEAMGATTTTQAFAAGEAGTRLQRLANAQSAVYLQKIAEYYYYEAGKSKEALSAELRRGGNSGRLEWWNAVDSPDKLLAEVQMLDATLTANYGAIRGRYQVHTLGAGINGVQTILRRTVK